MPSSAELPLTVEELRAVARYAVSCAEPVQGIWFVLGRHAPAPSAGPAGGTRTWLDPLHGVSR
ncbi:MAG: hypothetical protein DCC50_11375 [Acidobacteria bacterium]|nr:MAG: hypothetical protein DCC50_11375 [Acidobacteriota bacterium]